MSRQDQGPGAPARRGAEICFELANSRTRAPTAPSLHWYCLALHAAADPAAAQDDPSRGVASGFQDMV